MLRSFDIFEKFPDSSTLWRSRVSGRFETERKIQELSEHSRNEFHAMDAFVKQPITPKRTPRPAARAASNG